MPKVYNKRNKDVPLEAIYVGRPTKWGNPYVVGKHGKQGECVELYRIYAMRRYIDHNDTFAHDLQELRGKDLICWCAPKPCHADVLMELANE